MPLSMMKTIVVTAFHLILCCNVCSHAFTVQPNPIKAIMYIHNNNQCHNSFRKSVSFTSICINRSFIISQSTVRNKCNKRIFHSFPLLSTIYDDTSVNTVKHRGWLKFPLLERSHEKAVAILFGCLSAAILYFTGISSQLDGLPPIEPGKWLVMAETSLALTWSSMIIAISFLEAWTKFRSPFLKKYIAVDVGRHVFATLNAAELGISTSFWLHCVFQCYQVQKMLSVEILYKGRTYYQQFSFTLPAVATLSLLLQAFIIAPKLYLRAKRKILEGFDESLPSVKISMTKSEQLALADISQDLCHIRKIPSSVWHGMYAVIEIVKIGCLNAFVILSWLKLLA
jgi:hypothetical protein